MLSGRGFYVWSISHCEAGDPVAIAGTAQAAGLSHVLIKIADGVEAFNVTKAGVDLVPPLATALRERGVSPWGWHYVYGVRPVDEAAIAAERCKCLGLDGYVIDAESEFKTPGREQDARIFLSALRATLPDSTPVGLSSYRFPALHREFPWPAFLAGIDLVLPQVYWLYAHNPVEQLGRSVTEYRALTPLPIVPTGAAWVQGSWAVSPGDATAFLDAARRLGLDGCNFWDWQHCRKGLPGVWAAVAAYPWGEPAPLDPPCLPWPATVTTERINVRSAPTVSPGSVLGQLARGARPLVQELRINGPDLWGRVGDNLWCALRSQGAALMEWVR